MTAIKKCRNGHPLTKILAMFRWRYRHHVTYRCTHPRGCEWCSWCGFGESP